MATNPDLPEEILLEIFSRLPTKSVCRFRCLSKSWRRDLSTTDFIEKHLITRQQTIQQQNLALITRAFSLLTVTSPLEKDEQVKVWTGSDSEQPHLLLLGNCNGLVLLGVDGMFLMVMNPITLQQVDIPHPTPPWDSGEIKDGDCYYVYGFGYDCTTDDFKVIVPHTSRPYYEGNEVEADEVESETRVVVYSLKRGVWNRLDNSVYPYGGHFVPSCSLTGVLVNGVVHWFIRTRKPGVYVHIAAFDVAQEVFRKIPIPVHFDWDHRSDEIPLAVIGGCLSIVHNLSISGGNGTDVWMMKEYGLAESWVRFHVPAHEYGLSIVPICLVGDERLICYTEGENALVECDLKDGTMKKLIVGKEERGYCAGIAFVDSLISPEN